jgi:SNF2 family DNA or RNA helicase
MICCKNQCPVGCLQAVQEQSDRRNDGTKDAASEFLRSAFRLIQKGKEAPSNRQTMATTLLEETPTDLRNSQHPLTLLPYQLHAVNRAIQIVQDGMGVLLAYGMGLGKTIIIIGETALEL